MVKKLNLIITTLYSVILATVETLLNNYWNDWEYWEFSAKSKKSVFFRISGIS